MTDPLAPRAWLAMAPRLPVFWLAVLAVLAMGASAARMAWTWSIAMDLEARGVTTTATVVRVIPPRADDFGGGPVRLDLQYMADGALQVVRFRDWDALKTDARAGRLRVGMELPVRYLPGQPRVADLQGDRIARPWFELPVMALIAFLLAVFGLALRRDLRDFARLAATGEGATGWADRVQGWGPVARVVLREEPGTTPLGWGKSLLTTRARARALVAQRRVAVLRAPTGLHRRMILAEDRPGGAPLPPGAGGAI